MATAKLMAPKTIGIASETGKLSGAAVFGLPSVEQELTQLFHPDRSLFMDHMDVFASRKELANYAEQLVASGVDVVVMKEELARLLPSSGLTKDQILKGLFQKVDQIRDQEGANGSSGAQIKGRITALLDLDIEKYGAPGALALANALALAPSLPLGNIIYARDHSNVVFDHRIVSSMIHPIRRQEVALSEMVYNAVFGPHKTIKIPQGEVVEGGSIIVHKNTVYIDVGPRTTLQGALHVITELSKEHPDVTYAIVAHTEKYNTFKQEQQAMHLDMYQMPTGENEMTVSEYEGKRRSVYLVHVKDAVPVVTPTGKSLIDYLDSKGYELTVISKDEQVQFGCNIQMLDANTALMPVDGRASITAALRDKGKNVIYIPMDATTNGFGATHCAVGSFLRE